ncbi:Uncharacterised protein [Mycobacteroides abscessus subsp. abscessus]|nr:Uncharacterised protein [Mycobacteroides abscessus subsp. abscessus]
MSINFLSATNAKPGSPTLPPYGTVYPGDKMVAPICFAPSIGSDTIAGSTPPSQGEPGYQVVSSHSATSGMPGSARWVIGRVRQSKL